MKTINPAGWIYFLQNGDPSIVKIGFSINPKERRDKLQTGSPTELTFNPWPPMRGFMSQEDEIHWLMRKFKIVIKGADEWFKIDSVEARSIIESFRDSINRNSVDDSLPLLSFIDAMSDRYKKYDLLPKWPIKQLEKPDPVWPSFPWIVECPNGGRLFAQSLEHADKTRLFYQYRAKYKTCWFPDDII